MHKNFKGIEKTVFGRGSFNQLGDILNEKRNENGKFMLFVVDHYFKGRDLEKRIPAQPEDMVWFIDVDIHEPTTEQIDEMRDGVMKSRGIPSAVIGIGGGSVMDIAYCESSLVDVYQRRLIYFISRIEPYQEAGHLSYWCSNHFRNRRRSINDCCTHWP